jgi:carboxylesterase type B
MQRRGLPELPSPSEDCLYLNIYRPVGTEKGKRMPVLIYFHGGGFAVSVR